MGCAGAAAISAAFAGQAAGQGYDEITVTAQKREQSVLDVPISMSVFTGDTLETIGANGLDDLAMRTSNFEYTRSSDLKLKPATIRGVFGGVSGGADSAVGIYLDEVYLGTAAAGQFDLFDLERVEVLRGPQGSLFGRNTTGGAVSFTTRKPSDDPYGRFIADVGNYDMVRMQGALNAPIVEGVLAAKISGTYHERGGLTENVFLGNRTNAEESWSLRGQLRYTPSENVEINLSADYREADRQPTREIVADNFLFDAGIPGLDFVSDGDPKNFSVSVEADSIETLEAWGVAAHAVVRFDGFDITSITSYRAHDYFQEVDTDMTPIKWTYDGDPEEQSQFSQELRITSTGDRRLDWMAGLYYFHQDTDNQSFVRLGEDILAFLGAPTSPDLFARGTGVVEADSIAAFAQGVFHATERLHLTVGGRVTHDSKSIDYVQTDESGGVVGAVAPYSNKSDWTEFTGDATIAYDIGEASMVYAKVARGYKAGGFNDGLGSPNNPSFDPEYVWSYETGLKAVLAESRVFLNLSAFYMKWDDIQIAGFGTIDRDGVPSFGVFTGNFGKARSMGLEFDMQARPAEGFELFATAAVLDTKFTEGDPVDPDDPLAEPNIAPGNNLPFAPDWKFSGGVQYAHPTPLGELSWRLEYIHTGPQSLTAFGANGNDLLGHQKDYGLLDARVALAVNDNLTFSVWGRNLTDKTYATRYQNLAFPPIFSSFYALGEPRTYGVQLSLDF
jgi:iron complex outermembrane receptor protein